MGFSMSWSGFYNTVEEYDAALAEVKAAVSRGLNIGAKNENQSGGSTRKMEEWELDALKEWWKDLAKERNQLAGDGNAVIFTPGW